MSDPRDAPTPAGDAWSVASTLLPPPSSADSEADRTLDAPRSLSTTPVAVGPRIGRFVMLRRLGEGAMGVVWAAYDEVLDRRVAIKLFRPERAISAGDRERMLREARAMARLSHPNTLQVFDAGDDDGRMFVAMELVSGGTLRAWLTAPVPPNVAEIVAMFRGIASGLAAAHAAGVIHRDLKPENVMLDDRGAPKVADFGLAHLGLTEAETTGTDESRLRSSDAIDLTATGAVLGTPAYMAPEQHRGEVATAASDQFAFCVALWEALHGGRPFVSSTIPGLATAVCEGRREPPARAADVPLWLQQLALRGLAIDPAARWPSMEAIVGELARTRTRNRTGLLAASAVVIAGFATAYAMHTPEPCTGGRDRIATSWDAARREQLNASFAESTRFARATVAATLPRIDAWADAWVAAHDEACRATSVLGEQSAAVMDLRIACLQRARHSLDAVVDVIEAADVDTLARADDVVAALAEIESCADVDALQAESTPPSAAERETVEAARAALAHVDALVAAGKVDAARDATNAIEAQLQGIAYQPVVAELLLAQGEVLEERNDDPEAEAKLRLALALALRTDRRDVARAATLGVMRVVGHALDRPVEALALLEVARGLSSEEGREAAAFARAVGSVRLAAGEYPAAVEEFTRALALLQADPTSTPRALLTARLEVANAMGNAGRIEEARAEFARSIGELEQAYGAEHPQVARARHNFANWLILTGRLDEARAELDRVLAILSATVGDDSDLTIDARASLGVVALRSHQPELAEEQARAVISARTRRLGPRHAKVGLEHGNLGFALQEQGRLDEAAGEIATGLTIASAALGPSHPDVIGLRNNYGSLLHALGRDEEALAEHRACAAARRESLGADHPDTATSHYNIAVVSAALDRWEEVEAQTSIALPIWRAKLGDEHRLVYAAMSLRGQALLALGRDAEARSALEAAWKGQDRPDLPARKKAETVFALARALGSVDRDRAIALGRKAKALFVEIGPDGSVRARDADAWLATMDPAG